MLWLNFRISEWNIAFADSVQLLSHHHPATKLTLLKTAFKTQFQNVSSENDMDGSSGPAV